MTSKNSAVANVAALDTPEFEVGYRMLEPRIAFDAAMAATVDQVTSDTSAATPDSAAASADDATLAPADIRTLSGLLEAAYGEPATPPGERNAIVFIDAAAGDPTLLASAAPVGAEIVVLNANSDGLAQIARHLDGRTGIDAIHIISHGSAGNVTLGNITLDTAGVSGTHAADLAVIRSALSADADILFYGCNVGEGDAGDAFISAFAEATGADVAASTDDTGAAQHGGDWVLERSTGSIESSVINAADFDGLLAPTNTGTWTIAGLSASNTTGGITTTVSFAPGAGANFSGLANQTLNTIAAFSNGAQGGASLSFVFDWDTTPEAATGIPLPQASTDAGTGTVTITFSQAVTNPIIHIDRIGGFGAFQATDQFGVVTAEEGRTNSSIWTLVTPGATLTELAGVSHFDTTATTIQRTPNTLTPFSGTSTESGTNPILSTAAGSVRVNGTYTTITFSLTGTGVEGSGGDGVELRFAIDPLPIIDLNSTAGVSDTNRGFAVTYNEGSAPVAVADTDADVSDGGTNDLASLTIKAAGVVDGGNEIVRIGGVAFSLNTASSGTAVIGGTTFALSYNPVTSEFTITRSGGGIIPQASLDTLVRSVTYENTAGEPQPGVRTLEFQVTDTSGQPSNPAVATITVVPVNDAPVAVNDGVIPVTGSTPVTIDVRGNDSDPENDPLTVTAIIDPAFPSTPLTLTTGVPVTLASGTEIVRLADGTLRIISANAASGAETFGYVVRDPSGATASANVTLSRTPGFAFQPAGPLVDLSGDTPPDTAILYGHQQVNPADRNQPDFTANGTFSLVGNEMIGPGLTVSYSSSTRADISGAGTATLARAVAAGDYISMSFTTDPALPPKWLTEAIKLNSGVVTYKFAVAISSDGFATANLLGRDFASPGGGPYFDAPGTSYPFFNTADFALQAGQAYEVRVYLYDVSGGEASTIRWDDFYLRLSSDPIDHEDTFREGGPAISIATPDANVEDADSAVLTGGSVVLINKQLSDRLVIGGVPTVSGATGTIGGVGYTVTESAGQITVSLSGTASKAAYAAAIQAIAFENTSSTPSTVDRLFDVTVTDGTTTSPIAHTTIHVIPDAPPAIDLNSAYDPGAPMDVGFASTFTEGDAPVSISDSDADVFDAAEADIRTLTIVAAGVSDGAAEIIRIGAQAFPTNAASTLTVTAGATSFKVAYAPGTGFTVTNAAGASLVMPQGDLDTLVRSITYENTSQNPTAGNRTLTFVATDALGQVSLPAVATVSVIPVNDPPVAIADIATTLEDTPVSGNVLSGPGADTDVDGGALSVVDYTVLGVPGPIIAGTQATIPGVGAVVINPTGAFTFTPAANYNGPVPVVSYTVSDGNGGVATGTLTITVTPVNDPPTVDLNDNGTTPVRNFAVTFTEDGPPVTLAAPAAAVIDVDDVSFVRAIVELTGQQDGPAEIITIAGVNFAVDGSPVNRTIIVNGQVVSVATAGDGKLVFTVAAGELDRGTVEAIFRTIAYRNTSDAPGALPRAIAFSVNDGDSNSNVAMTELTLVPVNDPPRDGDETRSVNEDATLVVPAASGLLANTTDPDGGMPRVTGYVIAGVAGIQLPGAPAVIPGIGSITIASNGGYTFSPAADYSGPVPVITYTVDDGNGGTDTSQLALSIIPSNDAPVATDDTIGVPEDTPVSGNVLTNDSDVDGDPLTVVSYTVDGLPGPIPAGTPVGIPDVGSLYIDPNGGFTFTPATNYAGPIPSVTYVIADGNGEMDTGRLTLAIVPSNDPPTAVDDARVVIEDTPTTGTVLGNDTDPDADNLVVTGFTVAGFPGPYAPGATAVIPGVGTLRIDADGSYVFAPVANYSGPVPTVAYTIADPDGAAAAGMLTLTIAPTDDPGSFAQTATNAASVADSDAEVLEAGLASGSDPSNPREAAVGDFKIFDVDGIASLTVGGSTITIGALTAATAANPIIIGGGVGGPVYGTLEITGFNASTGTVAYRYTLHTADANVGGSPRLDTITLSLVDALGNSVPGTLAIAILDDAPRAVNDTDRAISTPGNPSSIAAGNVVTGAQSAGDPNGSDGLADTSGADGFASSPVTGVVAGTGMPLAVNVGGTVVGAYGTLLISADGSYVYTPDYADPAVAALGPNDDVSDTFTYQIADSDGSTSTATLTISITGTPAIINAGSAHPAGVDGIVLESDLPNGTRPVGQGEMVTGSFAVVVSPIDTIASVTIAGQSFTPAQLLAADPAAPISIITAIGRVEITGFDPTTGAVAYTYKLTTPQDHTGRDVFDLIPLGVTSGLGDQSDGQLKIQVTDDAPLAVDDADEVSENGVGRATGSVATGLDLGAGADVNTFDGTADVPGADGMANPVIAVGAGRGYPAGGLAMPIAGLYGTLTLNPDGSYTYAPNRADPTVNGLSAGESLNDVFTYVISDRDGDTASATLTVSILGANDAPVVINPANPGIAGNPIPAADPQNVIPPVSTIDSAIPPIVVMADYIRDPEGRPLTYAATGLPPGLSIDAATGLVTGRLPPDASQGGPSGNGQYIATVTVTDPDGLSATTTVTFTITNPPPVALDDAASSGEDGPPVTGNVITGSVATGVGLDNDPDKDVITVTAAVEGAAPLVLGQPYVTLGGGVLTLNTDGSYTFDPGMAYNGLETGETATETIVYTLTDADGASDTAQLVITIVGANDAPVIVDPANPGRDPANPIAAADPQAIIPAAATTDGLALTPINVSLYARDPDGEPLSYALDPTSPTWLSIDPVTGILTGTPPADASQLSTTGNPGEYRITVTVSDPDGATATTTITLAVTNVAPIATDDAAMVGEDAAVVTGNVITDAVTGDTDGAPDSDPLKVASALQGATPITIGVPFTTAGGGVLTLNADGSYTFAPGNAYNGLDTGETATETITYTVDDGNGGSATAVLVITVVGDNDAPVIIDPTNPGTPSNPIAAGNPSGIIPAIATPDGSTPPIVDIGAYVRDPDGEPLTFAATGLPPGLTIDPATGVISGTLPQGASQGGPDGDGVYRVIVTVTDPDGLTAETTVTYSIGNLPPVAVDDSGIVDRGLPLQIAVLGNDRDSGPDYDDLRVIAAVAQHGTVVINADGTLTYTPNTDYEGTDTISYRITDGNGGFAEAVVRLLVNKDPVVVLEAPFVPSLPMPVVPGPSLSADGMVGAVLAEIRALDQQSRDGFDVPEWKRQVGDFQGISSFSIKLSSSVRDSVANIETFVRGETLIVHLSLKRGGYLGEADWKVQRADGRPSPDWLAPAGRDVLMGIHPVGEEVIDLRVTAILPDGTEVVHVVRIQTNTGEIQPLKIGRTGDVAPPMLWEQFKLQRAATTEEIDMMARAVVAAGVATGG